MATTAVVELKAKDFKGKVDPDWCPGCGDFGLLNSVQKACAELGRHPHEILCVSGIGCSSNFPGFFHSFGMHTLHGRALAVASGAQMANHKLTVLATGGDGVGYGIGGNHLAHTARRNINITYLVMNNQIYGLTTGQVSPASEIGMKTKSTPFGNIENPVNPITTAIMNGATFVARGFSGHGKHLVSIIKQAIEHEGFSLVDCFSPCVTFNKDNTYDFFRQRIQKLEDVDHDRSDWKTACERAMEWEDTIYTGVYYQKDAKALHRLEPVLDSGESIAERATAMTKEQSERIIKRMM